jgi:adenylylsulfate kinase-like enzyme
MVNQLRINHVSKQIYIECPICRNVLITNDPEHIPESARNGKLQSVGGCQHFEIADIYKDKLSLEHNKENFEKAVLVIEKKKYFILVIPRLS